MSPAYSDRFECVQKDIQEKNKVGKSRNSLQQTHQHLKIHYSRRQGKTETYRSNVCSVIYCMLQKHTDSMCVQYYTVRFRNIQIQRVFSTILAVHFIKAQIQDVFNTVLYASETHSSNVCSVLYCTLQKHTDPTCVQFNTVRLRNIHIQRVFSTIVYASETHIQHVFNYIMKRTIVYASETYRSNVCSVQ